MATVNLGRIKPVFRGAYNNSTAYVIDDIVTSGNETFIAIAATQGNATSDASKWTKLAAKGADGTDVAATLANKEISFKTNAGALDGIPIGTAGQFLKVNSGATGYEFGTVSSDVVRIASSDITSDVGSVTFDNIFDENTYNSYIILVANIDTSNNDVPFCGRLRTGGASGTNYTSADYVSLLDHVFESGSGINNNYHHYIDGDYWRFNTNGTQADYRHLSAHIHLSNVGSSTGYPMATCQSVSQTSSQFDLFNAGHRLEVGNTNFTGITFFPQSGNFTIGKITIYGYKK